MKKVILTSLALTVLASSAFAADKPTKVDPAQQQQIQCIPGTLAERQAENRANFDKNMAEGVKEGAIDKEDVKKLDAANEVFVKKIMPFMEKKNPMMFCVNIEADLKAKGIPFQAGGVAQQVAPQATPATK